MFLRDRKVSSFGCFVFDFCMGASFSSFGCFVVGSWVLRFRVLGALFSRFGCFVLRSSFLKLPTTNSGITGPGFPKGIKHHAQTHSQ